MTENFIIILFILTAILWIWALVDIFKTKFQNSVFKIIWVLLIVIFPVLGSIIYFNFKNKKRSKQRRKFDPNFRKIQ